jgi:hypothetical protein
MPDRAGIWDQVVRQHELQPLSMASLIGSSWQFADAVFGYGATSAVTLLSTIRIRQLGFSRCVDTERMLRSQLAALQAQRLLPR